MIRSLKLNMYFDEQLFDQTPEGTSEHFREGTNLTVQKNEFLSQSHSNSGISIKVRNRKK